MFFKTNRVHAHTHTHAAYSHTWYRYCVEMKHRREKKTHHRSDPIRGWEKNSETETEKGKWMNEKLSISRSICCHRLCALFEWFASKKNLVWIIIYRIWQVKHLSCMGYIYIYIYLCVLQFLALSKLISMRWNRRISFYVAHMIVRERALVFVTAGTYSHKHFIENSIHTVNCV